MTDDATRPPRQERLNAIAAELEATNWGDFDAEDINRIIAEIEASSEELRTVFQSFCESL